jgi:hypothetical protein
MSFYHEMRLVNQASFVQGDKDQIQLFITAISAYVLWFYFDHRLDDETLGAGWFGELFLETFDPDNHSAGQALDETFALVLFRRDANGERRFADCLSIPARWLNATALSKAIELAELMEPKVFQPSFVLEDGRTIGDLWQEFFEMANDFFTDPNDTALNEFEEILSDILEPERVMAVMKELCRQLANFRR